MMKGTYANGTHEVVCYKGGQEWNRGNFPQFFNSITSVRAEVGGGETASISITLEPSFDDGILILSCGLLGNAQPSSLPKVAATGGASVTPNDISASTTAKSKDAPAGAPSNATYYAVRFLYPDVAEGDTPWYGGYTCEPDVSIDGGGISITVKVVGIHNLMSIIGGPVVINQRPALDVLKEFAGKFGVEIVFDPADTETESILNNAKVTGAFNEDYEDIIRRVLSDLRCSYVKYDGDESQPKPQYLIKSRSFINKQPIEYSFTFLRQCNPANGEIPLFTYAITSRGALYAPGHVFGTFRKEYITGEKRIDAYAGSPADYTSPGDSASKASGGALPMDTGDGAPKGGSTGVKSTGGALMAGNVHTTQRRSDVKTPDLVTAVGESSTTGAVTMTVTAPGVPRIRPLTYCQVTMGPGDNGIEAFSGPSHVQKLEHQSDASGWMTTLFLMKTGGPIYDSSANPKPKEAPKPPDSSVAKTPKDV